jgi:regulation of enolase protein 1 (concanavalin A-like superfamily)
MKILAVDLGKYNSVACQLDTSSKQPEYEMIVTHRYYIEQLLAKTQPELVVKVLVGRVNAVQNNIRALFDQQGIHIPIGHRAWTVAGIEELSRYRKSLAACHKQEFWQGELDLELTALEQLWQQLDRVDERLEQESKIALGQSPAEVRDCYARL